MPGYTLNLKSSFLFFSFLKIASYFPLMDTECSVNILWLGIFFKFSCVTCFCFLWFFCLGSLYYMRRLSQKNSDFWLLFLLKEEWKIKNELKTQYHEWNSLTGINLVTGQEMWLVEKPSKYQSPDWTPLTSCLEGLRLTESFLGVRWQGDWWFNQHTFSWH